MSSLREASGTPVTVCTPSGAGVAVGCPARPADREPAGTPVTATAHWGMSDAVVWLDPA
jgi:hypothetical protein